MFAMFKISQCAHLLCQINIDIFFTVFIQSLIQTGWGTEKEKKNKKMGQGRVLCKSHLPLYKKKIIFFTSYFKQLIRTRTSRM